MYLRKFLLYTQMNKFKNDFVQVPMISSKFSTVYLLIGTAGCRKSEWLVNNLSQQRSPATYVVSKHDFITTEKDLVVDDPKKDIHTQVYDKVRKLLTNDIYYSNLMGIEIWVDDDNLTYEHWQSYKLLNPSQLIAYFFMMPPEITIGNLPCALTSKTQEDLDLIMFWLKQQWQIMNKHKKMLEEKRKKETFHIFTCIHEILPSVFVPPTPQSPPPSPIMKFLLCPLSSPSSTLTTPSTQ